MMRIGILCVCLTIFLGGCSRSESAESKSEKPTADAAKATVQEIVDACASRDLNKVVMRSQRSSVDLMNILSAIGEFRLANSKLVQLVGEKIDADISYAIDQSYLLSDFGVGLFGDNVEVLDAKLTGGTSATVTYSANGQLPPKTATLIWDTDQWCLVPPTVCTAQLADALRELAKGLNAVDQAIRDGRLDAEVCKADLTILFREVALQLKPGSEMLPAMVESAGE